MIFTEVATDHAPGLTIRLSRTYSLSRVIHVHSGRQYSKAVSMQRATRASQYDWTDVSSRAVKYRVEMLGSKAPTIYLDTRFDLINTYFCPKLKVDNAENTKTAWSNPLHLSKLLLCSNKRWNASQTLSPLREAA